MYSPMTMSLSDYLWHLYKKKIRDPQFDSQISPTHILEGTWQMLNGLNGLNVSKLTAKAGAAFLSFAAVF